MHGKAPKDVRAFDVVVSGASVRRPSLRSIVRYLKLRETGTSYRDVVCVHECENWKNLLKVLQEEEETENRAPKDTRGY